MLAVIKNGPDPECPGLRFESGRWVRRYKSNTGKMKQYTFARHADTTIEQARAYVESMRGKESPLFAALGEITIGALIDRYLDEYIRAQRTPGALATVRSALTRNLKPIHTKPLDQVTAAMLHELILTTKKRAPTMAQLMRSELKQAWSYGLSIGMTETLCPITSLTGGRFKRNHRDRLLADLEVTGLIESIGMYSARLADAIIICLYTGLRSGEVIEIHSDEFETDANGVLWLTIPRERMKNNMAHRVPIFSKAREVIERRRQLHDGYLFPSSPNQVRPMKQVTLAREVYSKKGVLCISWCMHDLRRTTRTNLQRIGCPFEVSEAILAHKLPGVAGVYARFRYEDEKKQWLQALADYYDKLIQVN